MDTIPMNGHVFVMRGDLTKLACDAWLLPTDDRFDVMPYWHEVLGDHLGRLTPPPRWASGERARRFVTEPGRPEIWLGRIGTASRDIAWYVDGAESFIREAAGRLEPPPGRPPTVGIPHVGAGAGGAARWKGDLLEALFTRLVDLVTEVRVDVVVVAQDARAHGAAQRARMRALGGDGPGAVHEAQRAWAFETPERTARVLRAAAEMAGHLERQDLALFMGAGVSAGAGLPTWDQLLADLGMQLDPPVTHDHLQSLSDNRDRAALLDKRFARAGLDLRAALDARLDASRYSLQHGLMAGWPVREITTTNFDELFETAARAGGDDIAVIPGNAVKHQGRWLLKLHGTLSDPQQLVLTRESYLDAPRRWGALFGLVQAMLLTRHMLYVGYGLADEDFHELVHEVRAALGGAGGENNLGTAITLFDDPVRSELWAGELDVVAMRSRPASGSTNGSDFTMAARDVERFLDLIGMLSADRSAFILDPQYAGMLTESERALATALEPLKQSIAHDDPRDGWKAVAAVLRQLGRPEADGQ